MQSKDGKRLAELVAMLGEMYDKQVSVERMTLWFRVLEDYEIDAIEQAAIEHMRESRFMPTPADLIDRLKPKREEQAVLAWAEVPRLLRNSRAAKSSDPITEKVISDLGGWIALGQKTEKELVWVQKEFADRYQIYAQRGVDAAESLRIEHKRPQLVKL